MKADRIATTERTGQLRMRTVWFCVPALIAVITAGTAQAEDNHTQPAPAVAASSMSEGHEKASRTGLTERLKSTEAPVNKRRQQINGDCADLLKMATVLKGEVDKTTENELSVTVVRQAMQIEKLAHKVKDEMKPAVKRD